MKIRKIQTESRLQESYKKVTESYIELLKLSYKKGKEKETRAGCRPTELSGWVKASVPIYLWKIGKKQHKQQLLRIESEQM